MAKVRVATGRGLLCHPGPCVLAQCSSSYRKSPNTHQRTHTKVVPCTRTFAAAFHAVHTGQYASVQQRCTVHGAHCTQSIRHRAQLHTASRELVATCWTVQVRTGRRWMDNVQVQGEMEAAKRCLFLSKCQIRRSVDFASTESLIHTLRPSSSEFC